MTRILIFFLWILLITGAVTYVMTFDSRISGEAFGVRFDSPSWLFIGMAILILLAAIYATHKIKDILALPGKLKAKDAETKRTRGVAALTRGLEAVAVGDAADAAHHAKVAQKHLQDLALTRLLSAQAAQLTGDTQTARKSFSAMLEAPETEFLGLKGLYAQAMKDSDAAAARDYAERAFALRANAGWAFESVFELGLERGAWRETRDTLAKGKRNQLIDGDRADRASAALFTADAYGAHAAGDTQSALGDVESALKLAPTLTPAATLAAILYADKGKTGKAASVLETAFAAAPHPALLRRYDKLYADEPDEKRSEKLRKLAAKNPDAEEAVLAEARADLLRGEPASAMTRLERLITRAPNVNAYALMATAAAALHGEETGRGWLMRAADAPRDPRPGADGRFHFTRAGWARLVREYMDHERLAPPPLEDAGAAMSADELRQLTGPPPPDAEPAPDQPTDTMRTVDRTPDNTPESASGSEADGSPASQTKNSSQTENPSPTENRSQTEEPAQAGETSQTDAAAQPSKDAGDAEAKTDAESDDAAGERATAAARLTP